MSALLAHHLFWLFKQWTHGTRRALEAIADLGGVHVELGDSPAQRIPVHTELFGGLALVAAMGGKYLKDEALFELADGFVIGNTTGVHLANQAVQLAFHRVLFLAHGPNLGALSYKEILIAGLFSSVLPGQSCWPSSDAPRRAAL
jgi:hypothetical protein